MSAEAMRAGLAVLRQDYLSQLPALGTRVAEAAKRSRHDASARREATQAAHRIRGTAGSLGLVDIGEAAGRVEDALDAGDWDAVDDAVAELLALGQ